MVQVKVVSSSTPPVPMVPMVALSNTSDRSSVTVVLTTPSEVLVTDESITRCVCDLQPVAGVATNVLSYHLKVLREAGLVTSAKRGRWVDYTLAPQAHARLRRALPTADVLSGSSE